MLDHDRVSTLENQCSSGADMEATDFRGRAQTVSTGYKSSSVEPDPCHGRRVVSSDRLKNSSALEGQVGLLQAPTLGKEKKRAASQGSSDGMEDKLERSHSLRRTSAPDSPISIRQISKANVVLPVVSSEGERAESEEETREEFGKEDFNALTHLAHSMDMIMVG